MVNRPSYKTVSGDISTGLSYKLFNSLKKVVEGQPFYLLEGTIQEIYNSLTGRLVNFNGELKSVSDEIDFYKLSINEKLQRLEGIIEIIIRKKLDETLKYIQGHGYHGEESKLMKCKKEEEDVEHIIYSIKTCLKSYKRLLGRNDDYLRNYYKKGFIVKIKIDDKRWCTAKVLEVDVKHKKVLLKYVVKERCSQFRHVYGDTIRLDLNKK